MLVSIQRADTAFCAVNVPAGEHEVVFEYRAVSVWIGAVIGGVGMVGMVLAWLLRDGRVFSSSL